MLGDKIKEFIDRMLDCQDCGRASEIPEKGICCTDCGNNIRWNDELKTDYDELIKASEERDTLKARVDELEEIIENSEEEYSDMDADAQHWMEQYHSIKQDALLGKALKKAFEYNFEVYKSQGCIVVETNTHDIELLDWYQQQLEKEETSGK